MKTINTAGGQAAYTYASGNYVMTFGTYS
jgi:hypothetical protein